jgi:hypothetical protein
MIEQRLRRFCNTGKGFGVGEILPYTPLAEEFNMQNDHRKHVGAEYGDRLDAHFEVGDNTSRKQLFSYVASLLYKEVSLHGFSSSGKVSWAASVSREAGKLLLVDTKGKLRIVDPKALKKNGITPLNEGSELLSKCKSTLPKESKSWLPATIGVVGSCVAPTLARMEGQRMIDSFINSISAPKPDSKKVTLK